MAGWSTIRGEESRRSAAVGGWSRTRSLDRARCSDLDFRASHFTGCRSIGEPSATRCRVCYSDGIGHYFRFLPFSAAAQLLIYVRRKTFLNFFIGYY